MERRLASLRAEVSAPERNKFTAPLLLLHGLWSGGWVWHEAAGALSQRGWECWALDLRGRPGSRPVEHLGRVAVAGYAEDVLLAAGTLWGAPAGGALVRHLPQLPRSGALAPGRRPVGGARRRPAPLARQNFGRRAACAAGGGSVGARLRPGFCPVGRVPLQLSHYLYARAGG